MAIVPDRIDKLVTIAHIVAIVGMLGLLVFGAVRGVLWPYGVFLVAMPLLWWLARRRMWTLLRKHDVRCVACGAALWVPHAAFAKPSYLCPSCGQLPFARTSPKPRRLPWFARDVTGTMRFFTLWTMAMALGFALWVRFVKDLPLGELEWTLLLLTGVVSGPVIGAMFWHVYAKYQVEAFKQMQDR
jgi:hypothetical protein